MINYLFILFIIVRYDLLLVNNLVWETIWVVGKEHITTFMYTCTCLCKCVSKNKQLKSRTQLNIIIKVRFKYIFGPIFVVFVADDPHFDRMFKMVIIFTECLKWSSFSQFVFYLVLFGNAV